MRSRNPSAEIWRRRGGWAVALLPLALLFRLLVDFRRRLYRMGILHSHRLPVPVVVVGNITAGGSGKTPLVLWLLDALGRRGRCPGVVSRGHGGSGGVQEVLATSDPNDVGDEPLLLKRRSQRPVFVGRDRVAAARALIATHPECDLILSDDGLQHYRLRRDFEIAVQDGRGLMNGWPLPAGPLREPASRLREVDALVVNGADPAAAGDPGGPGRFGMRLVGDIFRALDDIRRTCRADHLVGLNLAAVAGIGDPRRFFEHLAGLGLSFTAHPFPDHHRFAAGDFAGIDADALLITEKDAVKCAGLTDRPVWVLPVTAQIVPDLTASIMEKLNGCTPA